MSNNPGFNPALDFQAEESRSRRDASSDKVFRRIVAVAGIFVLVSLSGAALSHAVGRQARLQHLWVRISLVQ